MHKEQKQIIGEDNPSMVELNEIVLKTQSSNGMNDTMDRIIKNEDQKTKNKGEHKGQHDEEHIDAGDYLKSSVYGGLDGIVNSLTIILTGIASGAPTSQILAIGVAALVADGLGMGLGDYLSAKAQKQFIKSQQQRQFWEVKHKLLKQKAEIIEIYTAKDYKLQEAERLSELYATNDQAFVNIMMLQELGLAVDEDSSPLIGGIVTFFAFAIFGALPFIPYYASRDYDQKIYLIVAIVVGGVELFSLGYAKASLIGLDGFEKMLSGTQSLGLGAVAVAIGYGIGVAFNTG